MAAVSEPLLWGLLGYVVFPLWLLAGLADYLCHSRTDLAHTSGVHESVLHLLQTAEIAVPALVLLFLDVTAATLALMVAGVAAHVFTSWRDLHYAARLRYIPPFEQYVHAFLIVLPLVALAIVAILHWPEVVAMADPAIASDWSLRWRQPAFRIDRIIAVLAAALVFGVLPGLSEFINALMVAARAAQASRSSDRSSTKLP